MENQRCMAQKKHFSKHEEQNVDLKLSYYKWHQSVFFFQNFLSNNFRKLFIYLFFLELGN